MSDFISQEPVHTSDVVIPHHPNTGNADTYNEKAIEEAVQEVNDHLVEDTYPFRVRRGTMDLDEESVGPRSTRPGFVTIWRVQSDAKDPSNPKNYILELEKASCSIVGVQKSNCQCWRLRTV